MSTEIKECKLPTEIKSIQIGYDGGRFCVTINEEVIYINKLAGIDFSIDIREDEITFTDYDY
jgi:hypothetical protein